MALLSASRVLILAGEASGDAYGAALANTLVAMMPGVELIGTGGPRMRSAGVELLADLEQLAVMGFTDVLPRMPYFFRLERRIDRELSDPSLSLAVLIDYPGMNLRVARAAHRRRVPVLYYVAPKVWAWGRARARVLAESVDRVASILPFEVEGLARQGVRATFVGHPLLDDDLSNVPDRVAFSSAWGLDPARSYLALLPGSREQEVVRHLDAFVDAARAIQEVRPDVLPVIARVSSVAATRYERAGLPVVHEARGLLRHARVALVKSGTGTLEAALAGTPMVVAYRASALTWALAKRLVKVPYVALPNLLAGTRIVPEYLQSEVSPTRLADDLLDLLDDGAPRAGQLEAFARLRVGLGEPGVARRVAVLAADLMGTRT